MTQLALSDDLARSAGGAVEAPKRKNVKPLNLRKDRYQRFAQEYVIDRNGTRAAIAAGYAKRSAHVTASNLLKQHKVCLLIETYTENRARELEITADRVVQELASVGFAKITDYVGENGEVVNVSVLSRERAGAIQELTVDQARGTSGGMPVLVLRTRLKLHSKIQALELIARILGFLKEKQEAPPAGLATLSDEELQKKAREYGLELAAPK